MPVLVITPTTIFEALLIGVVLIWLLSLWVGHRLRQRRARRRAKRDAKP
ncbi:lipopolysaccharide assembly protein LapA domain-containing protein [Methylobacterium aquaticum]|nr:lipopolysaccharide assembly protein LapA domain-containing protein [Methylobacterium aquaticum]QRE76499.1 DUF1049 domain-containing protein [Methylobacterium aquaticum]